MKVRLLLITICVPLLIKAQITLNAQLPSNSIVFKNQLWNMVVVNPTNEIVDGKLQIDVTDLIFGQSVLSATTGNVSIGKGMKVLTASDFQPIVYNYSTIEFAKDYFPCGSYSINYRLIRETDKGDFALANDIVRVNVLPLSPPLLLSPLDKAGIETVYPQFTWMPPVPIEMFSPLMYELNVVQVEDGQTPVDAIRSNKPVYFSPYIHSSSEKYASSYEQLQEGKTYAWQVKANSNQVCTVPSEVWVFTIGKDSIAKIVEGAPYIKISKSNTEIATVHQGFLKMEYSNVSHDKKVKFIISNTSRSNGQKASIDFELPLIEGKNYLMYDLSRKGRLDKKTVYTVSMINSRGEKWLMRFTPVYYK